jgi:hypothetical protein
VSPTLEILPVFVQNVMLTQVINLDGGLSGGAVD